MAATAKTHVGGPGKVGPNVYTAAAAPTADNNGANGIRVGDIWLDTTAEKAYVCMSNAATAAWKEMSNGVAHANIVSMALTSSDLIEYTFDTEISTPTADFAKFLVNAPQQPIAVQGTTQFAITIQYDGNLTGPVEAAITEQPVALAFVGGAILNLPYAGSTS